MNDADAVVIERVLNALRQGKEMPIADWNIFAIWLGAFGESIKAGYHIRINDPLYYIQRAEGKKAAEVSRKLQGRR